MLVDCKYEKEMTEILQNKLNIAEIVLNTGRVAN